MTRKGSEMRFRKLLLMSTAVLVCVAGAAQAGELEEKGRAVLDQYQKAVVTVQMVIKQKFSMAAMGSREQESKNEATGFVIDPTGLIVLSLSTTDPTAMMESMMGSLGDDFKIESDMSDVKILLDDGTEIPARVVLRDRDLDLAFVRPLEPPAEPMPVVDMTEPGEANVLDQLVSLTRLGKVANRECAASLERIHAVVKRPRKFYVPGSEPTQSGLGSPVFTPDGKFVGMLALRVVKSAGDSGMGMFSGPDDNMMGIVVPAEDIVEAAKQAPPPDTTT